jgi:hypothetical protein
MISTLALALPLLALTASAAPTRRTPSVQVQFANDVTGANGNADIPLDGSFVSLGEAYANTNLEVDGTLFVTSLEFTANFQNVACTVFKNRETVVASIADPAKDFETFSAKPLNWQTGFEISCAIPSTPVRRTPSVQVQFANDVTGANGNALIPLDGSFVSLGEAYANTNLEVDGTLFVTSLEFTANFQNVACTVFKNRETVVASIADPAEDFETFSAKPLNWQTSFEISCAIVSAPARRTVSTVQVQFANDVTGANGNALIPLDGTSISLGEAYANTNLEVDGTLFVTSLEFTADFQNVVCDVLKDETTVVAHIADPEQDFQTFSQKPLNWQTGFTISCTLA